MKLLTEEEYAAFRALLERNGEAPSPTTGPARAEHSTAAAEPPILVKITGFNSTTGYAWKQVQADYANKGQYVDLAPAVTGNNAWERGGNQAVPNNAVVQLSVEDVEADGTLRFGFSYANSLPSPSADYRVLIVKPNGSGGRSWVVDYPAVHI